MPMADCASNAKRPIRTATSSSSSNAEKGLTQPILKSRAAMTYSSTTTTRAKSIRKPTLRLFRREPKQPPFDASWSCGRICFFVTRRSCFSTTTSKSSAQEIDALFRAMAAENLDLAQPALSADSATAYPFLKRPSAGPGVTRVSSVEIMAPALTRRALETAKWVFAELVSGWGSDLLLGPAVRSAFGPNSVGIVGSVAVRHAAPVDLRAGAFYAFLRRYGVDPGHEANRIAVDFGVERFLRPLAAGRGRRDLPGASLSIVAGSHPLDRSGLFLDLETRRAARTECEGRTRPDFTR